MGFSPKTRQIILDRCDFVCERCSSAAASQLHHRRPRSCGGSKRADTNTPANCFAICEPCHRYIESNRTKALESGWLVRQGKNPADIPLLYRGRWALLTEAGGVHYI